MFEDHLRYDLLIDKAMRTVVKEVLTKVSKEGLLGEHHFLLSFLTTYPGSVVPPRLLVRYPEEMTIVLQYQYEGLEVTEDSFSVMLSFDGIKEKIIIPYDALTSFADPGVKFGLKFNLVDEESGEEDDVDHPTIDVREEEVKQQPVTKDDAQDAKGGANSNVVNLNFSRDK